MRPATNSVPLPVILVVRYMYGTGTTIDRLLGVARGVAGITAAAAVAAGASRHPVV